MPILSDTTRAAGFRSLIAGPQMEPDAQIRRTRWQMLLIDRRNRRARALAFTSARNTGTPPDAA